MEWSILLIDNSNRRSVNTRRFLWIVTYTSNTSVNSDGYLIFFYGTVGSGSMEFVVPPADSSVFFPISVRFSATSTFSDLKVCFWSNCLSINATFLMKILVISYIARLELK